jgi:membrane protein YqaA with SNARE-associated domain
LKLFSALYDRALRWARHPHAQRYLFALSFAEASFFPIPPDVILAPMTLAEPKRGWWLASLATLGSVAGGVVGYAIGWLAIDAITPLLHSAGYWAGYQEATAWFLRWGFLAVFAAGFSPIPYKVFTIAAGALHMFLPAFLLASLIGRGGRFFLVAGLIKWGGEPMERGLRRHVDTIGWSSLALLAVAYLWLNR